MDREGNFPGEGLRLGEGPLEGKMLLDSEILGTQKPNNHLNGMPTDSGDGWAHTVSSESLTRGTGCLNWARPGLWGFRVGNRPVLPGPC
jgi:hypothetical protein